MKRPVSAVLCIVFLFSFITVSVGAANVMLSPQNLTVNGRPVECEKYNIDGSNYFKLRDIAYLLNGTENQFEVGYDSETRTVTVVSGLPYAPNGEELIVGMDKSSTAQPSTQTIMINGIVNSNISAYNLAGNNFFKLRDLGNVLGFVVDYDKATNTAIIMSTDVDNTKLTPDSEPTNEMTAGEVYEKCSSSVFLIQTFDAYGTAIALGSGFFIDSNGIAVTNYHVLEDALTATATLTNGKEYDVSGVLYFDADEDYAVIKINGSGFSPLPVGDSSSLKGGEKVFAIGNPRGLTNTISDGIVSNPKSDFYDMIQITAPISPGSSGGALINSKGEVIGITQGTIIDSQNLNLAVPINSVIRQGSISQFESIYGVMSMSEYALRNGYINASGKQAFVSRNSRKDAYNAIKTFILGNNNDKWNKNIDSSPAFTCTYNSDDYIYIYTVAYDDSFDENLLFRLEIVVIETNEKFSCSMTLLPNMTDVFLSFGYYPEPAEYASYAGSISSFQPDSLNYDAAISFDYYSGLSSYKESDEDLAAIMACDALEFVEYIFESLITEKGIYNVADLGFASFYSDIDNSYFDIQAQNQTAFKVIKDFIVQNYSLGTNGDVIGGFSYKPSDDPLDLIYEVTYTIWDTIDIKLTYSYENFSYATTFSIANSSDTVEGYFNAYEYGNSISSGNYRFSPFNLIKEYYSIGFSRYSGNARETDAHMATIMGYTILSFIDDYLFPIISPNGQFSCSDLGFINYFS